MSEVYSGWDDYTPDAQNFSWHLSPGRYIDGAEYAHKYPVAPNTFRTASITTNAAFPRDATLLVYAATQQWATASVNDTTITAGINSAWYVNWVVVEWAVCAVDRGQGDPAGLA